MHKQNSFWFARRCMALSATVMSISLTACGSLTPTGHAWMGNPDPLIQEVLSDKVDPNGDYLTETGQDVTRTPLCVLAPLPSAAAAVDYLLAHGVDVNKPCSPRHAQLPVDAVMQAIYLALADKSPYDPEKYFREHIPANMATLNKLIKRGGTNSKKTVHSMDDVGVEVTRLVAQRNKTVADQLEDIRVTKIKEKQDSWFNTENLSAMTQVMSLAAQNYRSASSQSSQVIPITSTSSANKASVTSRSDSTKPSSNTAIKLSSSTQTAPASHVAPKLLNIVEPNSYEQYPNADVWASVKKPWKDGGWSDDWVATREQACKQSIDSLSRTVAEEEKTGYFRVTQKSNCVCRTSNLSNNWYCRAYFQSNRTGKESPSAGSR